MYMYMKSDKLFGVACNRQSTINIGKWLIHGMQSKNWLIFKVQAILTLSTVSMYVQITGVYIVEVFSLLSPNCNFTTFRRSLPPQGKRLLCLDDTFVE
jgi:hypothetical protein